MSDEAKDEWVVPVQFVGEIETPQGVQLTSFATVCARISSRVVPITVAISGMSPDDWEQARSEAEKQIRERMKAS